MIPCWLSTFLILCSKTGQKQRNACSTGNQPNWKRVALATSRDSNKNTRVQSPLDAMLAQISRPLVADRCHVDPFSYVCWSLGWGPPLQGEAICIIWKFCLCCDFYCIPVQQCLYLDRDLVFGAITLNILWNVNNQGTVQLLASLDLVIDCIPFSSSAFAKFGNASHSSWAWVYKDLQGKATKLKKNRLHF